MKHHSRRSVLRLLSAAGIVPFLPRWLTAGPVDEDERIALRVMGRAGRRVPGGSPMGGTVRAVGEQFLGAPYRAHTLEGDGPEHLVVNLRAFDCVTYVESTLALARCIAGGATTAEAFRENLARIRYRGGKIDGYASRLHYFSEWIDDNSIKGLVSDVTAELGGVPVSPVVNFMSEHAALYPAMNNPEVARAIRKQEERISGRPRSIIPAGRLVDDQPGVADGDIIAITTSVPGLDVVHTGFAARVGGTLHFLHAPLSGGVVIMSREPLAAMIRNRKKQTGIMVARPLRP